VKKMNIKYNSHTNSIIITNILETTYIICKKDLSNKIYDVFNIYLLYDMHLIHFKEYIVKRFNQNPREVIGTKRIFIYISPFVYIGKLNNTSLRL